MNYHATAAALLAAALMAPALAPAQPAPKPLRVILVGDSTMAPNGGYGDALCARLRPATCVNLGRAGRSSSSYRAEGRWNEVKGLLERNGDYAATYVLVQFGHNDQPGKPGRSTDLATEFPANIRRYAEEIAVTGARPVLVTPLARRAFEGSLLTDTLGPWAAATRSVARSTGAMLVDLHALSKSTVAVMGPEASARLAAPPKKNAAGEMVPDYTHLNADGEEVFGAIVERELARQVPELAPAS
jgi:lysophospholipase L1-like esterase